jgi:hypothetical protein
MIQKTKFLHYKRDELVFINPIKSNELLIKLQRSIQKESNKGFCAQIKEKFGAQNSNNGIY